jgi:FkbM family methyltransferase
MSRLAPDLVFDVGLHLGEDTAYYLSKGFRVVAFEANPALVRHCRTRFARELDEGDLTIVEGAIDDQGRGSVTFYIQPEFSYWGTTDGAWAERNAPRGSSAAIDVPTVDFAEALRHFGVPHYMKVDIEGADQICLHALGETAERPRFLSIESEKVDWHALESEFELLRGLGYRRFAVCQQAEMEKRILLTRSRTGAPLEYRFEAGSSGPFGEDITEPWTDSAAALERYRSIFRRYRAFGDDSPLGRTRPGRVTRRQLARVLRAPLPGWYDTHAERPDPERA